MTWNRATQMGDLDGEGDDAAQGVEAHLAVELHHFLLAPLGVLVLLLDFLELGLHFLHGAGGAQLANGEREGGQTDEDGEGDDGQPEIVEQDVGEDDQGVDHGVDEQVVPDESHARRLALVRVEQALAVAVALREDLADAATADASAPEDALVVAEDD